MRPRYIFGFIIALAGFVSGFCFWQSMGFREAAIEADKVVAKVEPRFKVEVDQQFDVNNGFWVTIFKDGKSGKRYMISHTAISMSAPVELKD